LIARGVPSEAILVEDGSNSTWQNFVGASELLEERALERVLIVSDGFHLLRAEMMARELGLQPFGRPARGSPIARWSGTELDYVVREAAAIVGFRLGIRD
jgi:uncharacterized SAM-binding protein YcdF (DUF218 family)